MPAAGCLSCPAGRRRCPIGDMGSPVGTHGYPAGPPPVLPRFLIDPVRLSREVAGHGLDHLNHARKYLVCRQAAGRASLGATSQRERRRATDPIADRALPGGRLPPSAPPLHADRDRGLREAAAAVFAEDDPPTSARSWTASCAPRWGSISATKSSRGSCAILPSSGLRYSSSATTALRPAGQDQHQSCVRGRDLAVAL